MDGDKLIALYAGFVQELLKASLARSCEHCCLNAWHRAQDLPDLKLKLGAVQTAYANGASTIYIANKLGLKVSCTPTGVKWLHHEVHARASSQRCV